MTSSTFQESMLEKNVRMNVMVDIESSRQLIGCAQCDGHPQNTKKLIE